MSTYDTTSSDNETMAKKTTLGLESNNTNHGANSLFRAQSNRPMHVPHYKIEVEHRKFANPAPLGLSAFALTTFVLSLINCNARHITTPNLVLSLGYAYGGLVQLLAGMWEMAAGNTFGATALSSYGGFWIAWAILFTPSFQALDAYNEAEAASVLGFFLAGWFIFTTILLLCTLRSSLMFFLVFFMLDITFLMLFCSEFSNANGNAAMALKLQRAGGGTGLVTAFLGWYNALAGIADSSNSFFPVPVFHFPWSDSYRAALRRAQEGEDSV